MTSFDAAVGLLVLLSACGWVLVRLIDLLWPIRTDGLSDEDR
jgi:hypothetical protein